jgi:hypothetical protein
VATSRATSIQRTRIARLRRRPSPMGSHKRIAAAPGQAVGGRLMTPSARSEQSFELRE